MYRKHINYYHNGALISYIQIKKLLNKFSENNISNLILRYKVLCEELKDLFGLKIRIS